MQRVRFPVGVGRVFCFVHCQNESEIARDIAVAVDDQWALEFRFGLFRGGLPRYSCVGTEFDGQHSQGFIG